MSASLLIATRGKTGADTARRRAGKVRKALEAEPVVTANSNSTTSLACFATMSASRAGSSGDRRATTRCPIHRYQPQGLAQQPAALVHVRTVPQRPAGWCSMVMELSGVDLDVAATRGPARWRRGRKKSSPVRLYAEVSPSGTGVKCSRGRAYRAATNVLPMPGGHQRQAAAARGVRSGRFTVTGDKLPGAPDGIRAAQRRGHSWPSGCANSANKRGDGRRPAATRR